MATTKGWRKLSRTPAHRKAMMRNMAASLLLHEKITTTVPKAKDLKRFVDRLITHAKNNDIAARRYIAGMITDLKVQKKLFDVIVPRYSARHGGYARIYKLGQRMSDSAPMGIVQLVG